MLHGPLSSVVFHVVVADASASEGVVVALVDVTTH